PQGEALSANGKATLPLTSRGKLHAQHLCVPLEPCGRRIGGIWSNENLQVNRHRSGWTGSRQDKCPSRADVTSDPSPMKALLLFILPGKPYLASQSISSAFSPFHRMS